MLRRRINKSNQGKYQAITTEMRKKVIELVVNFNMSIKQAAHCVGIHPQTAKNFFIIYKNEGRIGKKQKRNKKRLNESFHQMSIKLDQEYLEKSKLESPDWIFTSFVHANEFHQFQSNSQENELSRIPVYKDIQIEKQQQPEELSQEPTQKVQTTDPIKIKQEFFSEQNNEQQQPSLINCNNLIQQQSQQYQQFQNSQYCAQLLKNLNFNAYLNQQLSPFQKKNNFLPFQQSSSLFNSMRFNRNFNF